MVILTNMQSRDGIVALMSQSDANHVAGAKFHSEDLEPGRLLDVRSIEIETLSRNGGAYGTRPTFSWKRYRS